MADICEMLGVTPDEEWRCVGCCHTFRIHDGIRQALVCDEWWPCNDEASLLNMIKRPDRIIHIPRWTLRDEKDAEATRQLFNWGWVARDLDGCLRLHAMEPNIIHGVWKSDDDVRVLCHESFPSLVPGDKAPTIGIKAEGESR